MLYKYHTIIHIAHTVVSFVRDVRYADSGITIQRCTGSGKGEVWGDDWDPVKSTLAIK